MVFSEAIEREASGMKLVNKKCGLDSRGYLDDQIIFQSGIMVSVEM